MRLGSVTGAAESEHVAQPSVSKQLRLLERELGIALFHRVGRHIVPTDAALALADCADRVFDDLASTVARFSGADGVATLRICATETVSDHLLPPALTALQQRFPRAQVRVEMLGTDDSVARVLSDEVDFAIVALPLADSRLDVTPLLREEVLLAVPAAHPFAGRAQIAMAGALEDPALLLSMPGHGLRALVESQADALRVAVTPRIELRSQQALLAMVAAGGGIAFAPAMSLDGTPGVTAVRLSPPQFREVGWVRRKGRHIPPIGLHLLALIAPP